LRSGGAASQSGGERKQNRCRGGNPPPTLSGTAQFAAARG
jgi:hypothetical protein